MGKKSSKKAVRSKTCGACKNFTCSKSGQGRCGRKDKKRSAGDNACGDFKAR